MSAIKKVTYFTAFRLGDSAILEHRTMLSKTLYQDATTTTV